MKRQKSCGPCLGKLVHQLPGVVTFAYDLRFRRVIARWKGIIKEINFGGSIMPLAIIENLYHKKPSFRPSKWPRKLKPAKNSKLPKLPENCFEPVGKGGWPPISTWINVSHINTFRCISYAHIPSELRKKLDDRSEKCIFIGYSETSKAYRLYNPITKKLILSRDVKFLENQF
jgi:hypothetical protein